MSRILIFLILTLATLYSKELIEFDSIKIEEFKFSGNSVIDDEELKKITAKYLKKELSLDELEDIRIEITKTYVDLGYINSGAIIKNQEFDKTLEIDIFEGTIDEINLKTSAIDRDFILDRLDLDKTLNIHNLKERLTLLKNREAIETIKADIEPTDELAKAKLNLEVKEKNQFSVNTYYNNYQSENTGAKKLGFFLKNRNLTGVSDSLILDYGFTKGKDEFLISYARELDENLELSLISQKSNLDIVTKEFKDLDIETTSQKHQVALKYNIFKTLENELNLKSGFGYEKVRTSILNQPFSTIKGSKNGEYKSSSLELGFDYLKRLNSSIIYLNSNFDIGLNLFDSLDNQEIDNRYLTYLLESLYMKRLDSSKIFKLKSNIFLSNDRLLPSKKLSLGGVNSVRGYSEGVYSVDRALLLSGEVDIKINNNFSFIPFIDFAKGSDRDESDMKTLASLGVGFNFTHRFFDANLFLAKSVNSIEKSDTLQSSGVHFQLKIKAFE